MKPVQKLLQERLFSPASIAIWLLAMVIFVGLYGLSQVHYLLFHSIIEISSIVIAFTIFTIFWNTRRTVPDSYFLLVGVSFFFIGSLDLVHTIAYKGMGIFPGDSADLPTQVWIAARYYQGITFFMATLLVGKSLTRNRRYDATIIITACTTAFFLILASIFVWGNFPHCYVEGEGLTRFKVISEYVISGILAATIFLLLKRRSSFDPRVWQNLVLAQGFLIGGELAFTSYVSVYGFMNMIGHLAKLLSFYFFYRAFVVVGLTHPHELLFREMKEKESSMNALLNAPDESSYLIEPNGRIIAVNAVFADRLGLPAAALGKMNYYDVLPGDVAASRKQWIATVIRTKRPVEFSDERFGRIIENRIYPVFDPDGSVTSLAGFGRDITGAKESERRLRESEEKYRELVTNSQSIILKLDRDMHITFFNEYAQEFFGYTEKEILGKHLLGTILPEIEASTGRDLEKFMQEILFHPENHRTSENENISKIGERSWISWRNRPVYNSSGEFDGLISVGTDITERKRVEEAYRLANNKLNILSSITRHDILNQLTPLLLHIEVARGVSADPNMQKGLDRIEKIARNIQRQIEFTRLYQDIGVKSPLWQEVFATIRTASESLDLKDVHLSFDIPPLEVYADPLLEKVFYNLMENALRHGKTLSNIRFSMFSEEGGITILCEDDGVGIPQDLKEKIFRREYYTHTGFGLYVSREILSITGITITETGIPGKGAKFAIHVPDGDFRTKKGL